MATDVPHPGSVRYVRSNLYDDNSHHTCVATAAARDTSSPASKGDDDAGVGTNTDVPPGARLVRVPIDELQQTDNTK